MKNGKLFRLRNVGWIYTHTKVLYDDEYDEYDNVGCFNAKIMVAKGGATKSIYGIYE